MKRLVLAILFSLSSSAGIQVFIHPRDDKLTISDTDTNEIFYSRIVDFADNFTMEKREGATFVYCYNDNNEFLAGVRVNSDRSCDELQIRYKYMKRRLYFLTAVYL